jgi:flavin reductase (DIM6/NTAB) family NADH-FMN oxidoreductase RutF
MAELPACLTVITSRRPDGTPVGATMSAVTSLSLEPAMLLACFASTSETLRAIEDGQPFLVHILGDGQQALARRFARKGPEKFDAASWRPGPAGLPQLAGCALVIACRTESLVPAGDHVIVTGAIEEIVVSDTVDALVYHRRRMFVVPPDLEDAPP